MASDGGNIAEEDALVGKMRTRESDGGMEGLQNVTIDSKTKRHQAPPSSGTHEAGTEAASCGWPELRWPH